MKMEEKRKNIYDETVQVARRTMVLFFVIDTSGSMEGSKIGTLNSVVEDVIPEIRQISNENTDAQIKIAVLEFSEGAKWHTSSPMDLAGYSWIYLNADGITDLGAACKTLNEKLSIDAFMGDVAGSFAPAIFLLSDGVPTDDYKKPLSDLWQNNWFKKAIKVAIAIGNDANKAVLKEFTGNSETVLTVHSPEALRKMIRFVSLTASQIGSKSSSVGKAGVDEATSKQEEFIKQIKNADISDEDLVW
jgi:uncharacterized protein YegL